MSKLSWQDSLNRMLNQMKVKKPDAPPRVAVVGIGHELRGDDGAGIAVAHRLQSQPAGNDDLLVIDAGPVPENHTGVLRRFRPDLIILVDTAQMDKAPGTVRWLAWQETVGLSASTHTLPPSVLVKYLIAELGCEIALVGIQPVNTALGAPLSPVVQRAVDRVVASLAHHLCKVSR